MTGVSGSGKSSLVFDTLYAEGQRRYVQSMSTYARLFLEQMQRPDVESISNIPPAIALEQKNSIKNARSTVGTITEVQDYLRLLMTHAGTTRCVDCNADVTSDSPESAATDLLELPERTRTLVVARIPLHGMDPAEALENIKQQGYGRLFLDGQAQPIEDVSADALSDENIDVIVDRIAINPNKKSRLQEALESAFRIGNGRATVVATEADTEDSSPLIFDRSFRCKRCDREYAMPTPQLFSFNSPLGACSTCEGFGRAVHIDIDKVIPNKRLSLRDGAVAPWSTPAYADIQRDFLQAAERHGYSTELPYSRLPDEAKEWIFEGDRETLGIEGFFRWLENRRYKTHVRILLARYRSYRPCPTCDGARLKPTALAVKIGRRNIANFTSLNIEDLATAISNLKLSPLARQKSEPVLRELKNRLAYLTEVGLGYLTLDRQARTLSGGEAQRIHLAAALGSALTDTLYALDEPTVGLHPRDSHRLLKVLGRLTKAGNTVVVVEHDPTIIGGADHVIDLGPGGGAKGGEILFAGKAADLPSQNTATGRLLLIRTIHRQKTRRPERRGGTIVIHKPTENNLRIDKISIPLRRLVCVTGVSGSGKSTLVNKVLYENYLRDSGQGGAEAGICERIEGFDKVENIQLMTQTPIGRSLRSNPATYVKCYDEIRKTFAATTGARRAKITPGSFSFNTVGGRCERCQGTGSVTIEMHFMADIDVPCDDCGGKRFKPAVLEVRYRDKNIHDVLKMTIDEAYEFFQDRVPIRRKLECLRAVGLGYLQLGQTTSTLSGGEAQRLKLSAFLIEEAKTRGTLFIFDEPTTGLHLDDVHNLISVLDGLVERGHSVVVVEHHTDFISHADHVIDLGPEGGDEGGQVVIAGTPLEVAECPESFTGKELRELLGLDDDESKPTPKKKRASRKKAKSA